MNYRKKKLNNHFVSKLDFKDKFDLKEEQKPQIDQEICKVN